MSYNKPMDTVIFAIFDNEFHTAPAGKTHYEWLVGGRYMCGFVYEGTVLGHLDSTGVYFYYADGSTSPQLEKIALHWGKPLVKRTNQPIFCGLKMGVGSSKLPIKRVD